MANNPPHLSIVVPVFNGQATLQACVNSVLQQPFSNFELILVNDGSQDQSARIMAELAQQDNRIRCVHQNNQGLPLARNAGLKIAQGRYVSFVDCDDLIHPHFYTAAFQGPTPSEFDLFVSGMDRFANEAILKHKQATTISPLELFESVFCSNHVGLSVCNKIFNLGLMQQHGIAFKPVQFAEDIVFLSDYLHYAHTIVYTPESLYDYTIGADSMTNSAKVHRQFKPRDYEILDALDISRSSISYQNSADFRHYFSIRSVRSALRLIMLMLWCREFKPQASQKAIQYIRSGIWTYVRCKHTAYTLKSFACLLAITPIALLHAALRLNQR